MFKFHPDRVNFDLELGEGVSGAVYAYQKSLNDPEDNKWAVKSIVTKKVEDVINHIQEIVLGFSCENPHVLPVRGYHLRYEKNSRDWHIFIKLPRMAKSLTKVIQKHRKDHSIIPEDKIIKYFYAIAQGLEYLLGRGIAHRDIKPDNILLDEDEKSIRIADFGLGTYYGGQTSTQPAKQAGALFYVAPENLDNSKQIMENEVFKTDLWSLGMVMFELCTLLDLKNLDYLRQGANKEEELKKHIQVLEGKYSKALLELILQLLRFEPDQRIGLLEVKKILEENYERYLESEKVNSEEIKRFRDLESSLKTKIGELKKALKAKDQEIEEMTKHYQHIINDYEEAQKKRNKELEELLESKMERLYQDFLFT